MLVGLRVGFAEGFFDGSKEGASVKIGFDEGDLVGCAVGFLEDGDAEDGRCDGSGVSAGLDG